MHKIIIQSHFGNVTITKNHIILDNQQFRNWENTYEEIQTNFFYYSIRNEEIFLKLKNVFAPKNPLKIFIKKSVNWMNAIHLDVGFKFPLSQYSQMNGLFGKIGNKRLAFYNNVQLKKDTNHKMAISVNGILTNAEIVKRSNSECVLVDVKDLLKPSTITEFKFKNI